MLELRRDRHIDVMCLAETWHDTDSVAFRRLSSAGYQVVDRPRPRPRVGHGLDPSMDWIGLDWVRIMRKLCGLDWVR